MPFYHLTVATDHAVAVTAIRLCPTASSLHTQHDMTIDATTRADTAAVHSQASPLAGCGSAVLCTLLSAQPWCAGARGDARKTECAGRPACACVPSRMQGCPLGQLGSSSCSQRRAVGGGASGGVAGVGGAGRASHARACGRSKSVPVTWPSLSMCCVILHWHC